MRTGDKLTKTKEQRNAEAAIKDPILGILPQFKPFHMSYGVMEPVEVEPKAFLSPVFLVDPMFTKDQKDDEIAVFRDNDFGGWEQPVN